MHSPSEFPPIATDRASRRTPRAILLTLCLGAIVATADTVVVNLGLHAIGQAFAAPLAALQWVIDSYNLTYAALLLTAGVLADWFGGRRLFVAGSLIFTLASILCALAPSLSFLIAARVMAGIGAAALLPASLALIRQLWPAPVERHRALSIWAACNGLAMALGPTIGGLLIHHWGWQSLFWAALPLSGSAAWLAFRLFPASSAAAPKAFDLTGQCSGAIALLGLSFFAIELHGARSALAWAALLVGGSAVGVFIRAERRRGDAALVPPRLFHHRLFAGAFISTSVMTFGIYGVLFLVPLTWQSSGMLGATASGLALMPMAVSYSLVSLCTGWMTAHGGLARPAFGGVAIIGASMLLLGVTADLHELPGQETALALAGLGMGLATAPLMGLAVSAVDSARAGMAAALINTARMVGATAGVATMGAVYRFAGSGFPGLERAMLFAGCITLAGAMVSACLIRIGAASRGSSTDTLHADSA